MSKLIEYFRELNINNNDNLKKYIDENDVNVLSEFLEHARNLVHSDWIEPTYTPFSFVPSADLSGTGGCDEVECKIGRANIFAKFASLYCDSSYLNIDLLTMPHDINVNNEIDISNFKRRLFSDLMLVNLYSPLISNRIIKITPPFMNLCPDCFEKNVHLDDDISKLDILISQLSDKANIVVNEYIKEDSTGIMTIKNLPEIFPDHDGYMIIKESPLIPYLNTIKCFPSLLRHKEHSKGIIGQLIKEQYINLKFETYISSAYKSKYITSQEVSKCITDAVGNRPFQCNQMLPVYDMPIINNLSIENILRVRENERETFNNYRVALNSAIKEHYEDQNDIEIKEIYDDIIYPSFIKLESVLKSISQQNNIKTVGEIAIIGTTVTLGVLSGIVPPNPSAVLTALGGSALLSTFGHKAIDTFIEKNKAKENDYYFLWKLKSDSERRVI